MLPPMTASYSSLSSSLHGLTPSRRAGGVFLILSVSLNAYFLLAPTRASAVTWTANNAPPPGFWRSAKYVDLTHAIKPDMPVWAAFAQPKIATATCGTAVEGLIGEGETFEYAKTSFTATQTLLTTDQLGTQLDPPAHWHEKGATISDVPPTVALRPLVVIDITAAVAASPGYHAQPSDVLAWEEQYGVVPAGSVVLFRSDWSKGWADPEVTGSATFPGVGLAVLKMLHEERHILVHGHEPLDTDMTPTLEGEQWLLHHNYMQIEGAANLHLVPPSGALASIGFPKIQGGTGGYLRLVAICPPDWPHGASIDEAPGAPLPEQPYPLRRGADGVFVPTPGATPTDYCASAFGCPPE